MSQYSDYSAPSLDGYSSLSPNLPKYNTVSLFDTKKDMSYYQTCYNVPNAKYPDCPAIMDDGRALTDYRSSCYINDMIRVKNNMYNSYDYRQYLIHNAVDIMNNIRMYNIKKSGCKPCEPRPINCYNVCDVSPNSVSCSLKKQSLGQGLCYTAVPRT